jgi:hypothetical protein
MTEHFYIVGSYLPVLDKKDIVSGLGYLLSVEKQI